MELVDANEPPPAEEEYDNEQADFSAGEPEGGLSEDEAGAPVAAVQKELTAEVEAEVNASIVVTPLLDSSQVVDLLVGGIPAEDIGWRAVKICENLDNHQSAKEKIGIL